MKLSAPGIAIAASVVSLLAAGPAFAISGYSTAHLNLRTGPGTQYPVVGVMEYNVRSEITGCLVDWTWCAVNVAGLSGWASAEYLVIDQGGQIMQITGPDSGIAVVAAEGIAEVVAGPAVGVVVGAGGHVAAIIPEPAVIEYIAATPVPAVAVTGEIVVGAVVPVAIQLYQVPGSVYGYAVINHNKVLVDVNSRAIVYIHR